MSSHNAALAMVCGLVMSMAPSLAAGQQMPVSGADSRHDFDIPALPLVQALDRYAALTRRPALFSSEMVEGRTSTPVHGRHRPDAALLLLLQGTGLTADIAPGGPTDAFVLRRVDTEKARAAIAPNDDYAGLIQARLWRALCGSGDARPGSYRALLRFEVDRAGALRQVRLLGSTGDATRDRALRSALTGLTLDAPPPPGMPQPVTMLIRPDASSAAGVSARCSAGER